MKVTWPLEANFSIQGRKVGARQLFSVKHFYSYSKDWRKELLYIPGAPVNVVISSFPDS